MFWLKQIRSLLQALHDDTSPNELAAGVALGAILGLVPKSNLLALALFVSIFIFRVNGALAGFTAIFFAILGAIFDPWTEQVGFWLLTGVPALKSLWTALYNTPIIPFTAFNNTLVMGNLTVGLVVALPLFFAARAGVGIYRARYKEIVMRYPIMKALTGSKWFDTYDRWVHRS